MRFFLFFLTVFFFQICVGQQMGIVDFTHVKAQVKPLFSSKKVEGTATYAFRVLKDCDSVYLDAVQMKLVEKNTNTIEITATENKIWLVSNFIANTSYTVSFAYEATPKKSLYFIGEQLWTQGQGKNTSNWLPSLDDENDKIEFDISVISALDKTVVSNGVLDTVEMRNDFKTWSFDMKKPMSSYLVAITVGDFNKKQIISDTGVPIFLYYNPKDSLKVEPTYRYTKQLFDFLEKEIGVPYPWQNYKQVPVKDFLYAGMENTTVTIFSDAFVVDSIAFIDRNYVNVNAHELAHQWFGNLVTEKTKADHWLHEGFATYYALLAEKEIFGDDYFYWKLFQSAEQLKALSEEGKGESLLNPKASSLTFYEKGAWALHILREKVGDEVFKNGIKNYVNKYQFSNVTTENFIVEIEKEYGKKLDDFRNDWLKQSAFKAEQAYQSLIKSPFINDYFKISSLRETSLSLKERELSKALSFPNDFIGQEVIYQLEGEPLTLTLPLYKKAFNSNNLFVRQAIALSLSKIPMELKLYYETLLNDKSYTTQEAALGNLWVSFPENRIKYLNKMKNVVGFNDKNIRQFWLFLAIITEDYTPLEKGKYIDELKGYTSSKYGNNVREKAFEYINYMELWDLESLINLIDAGQHHYWRFKKSSRVLLKSLLKNEKIYNQIIVLKKELDTNSNVFLDRMIKEIKR